MYKQNPVHAVAAVNWYKKEEIGKSMPPANSPSFAANARFKHAEETDLFSVILYFTAEDLHEKNSPYIVHLYFFAPQLVLPRLSIGSELYVTEGPKIIGEAVIISISPTIENR
jgi:hypothetical protein